MIQKKKIELSKLHEMKKTLRECNLHTVCEEARCPNISECFTNKTATFMIMGNICTRGCKFCNVKLGWPMPLDSDEPLNVANTVRNMDLKYVVITSVTRDDLPDGGAGHFAKTVEVVRGKNANSKIEVLTPDFKGSTEALDIVLNAGPDVFNHNIETVKRLSPSVRPKAKYERSLEVLKYAESRGARVKSGIIVGLGENMDEIVKTMMDLRNAGTSVLTIGQYYSPSFSNSWPVAKTYDDEFFEKIRNMGLGMGFNSVFAGRFVRSSYMAHQVFNSI